MLQAMGAFLDAKLRKPSGYIPASVGAIKNYDNAVEYGLAQHAGLKVLAKGYPDGNWEAPAGYYYQAVEIAANRTSPLETVKNMLTAGDLYATAEIKRLHIGQPAPAPPPAETPTLPLPDPNPPAPMPPPTPPAPPKSRGGALVAGVVAFLAGRALMKKGRGK